MQCGPGVGEGPQPVHQGLGGRVGEGVGVGVDRVGEGVGVGVDRVGEGVGVTVAVNFTQSPLTWQSASDTGVPPVRQRPSMGMPHSSRY